MFTIKYPNTEKIIDVRTIILFQKKYGNILNENIEKAYRLYMFLHFLKNKIQLFN